MLLMMMTMMMVVKNDDGHEITGCDGGQTLTLYLPLCNKATYRHHLYPFKWYDTSVVLAHTHAHDHFHSCSLRPSFFLFKCFAWTTSAVIHVTSDYVSGIFFCVSTSTSNFVVLCMRLQWWCRPITLVCHLSNVQMCVFFQVSNTLYNVHVCKMKQEKKKRQRRIQSLEFKMKTLCAISTFCRGSTLSFSCTNASEPAADTLFLIWLCRHMKHSINATGGEKYPLY